MKHANNLARKRETCAPIFAALGDTTRLKLVAKLGNGEARSIAQLAAGSPITRQAITKHLRVLESAGIVHNIREGRQSLFKIEPKTIDGLREYLDQVSSKWDNALSRLKSSVGR